MSFTRKYNDTSHAERLEAHLSAKRSEETLLEGLRSDYKGPATVAVVHVGKPVSLHGRFTRAVRPPDYTHPQCFLSPIACREIDALPVLAGSDNLSRLLRVTSVSWDSTFNMTGGNFRSDAAVEAFSRSTPISSSQDPIQLSIDLSDHFLDARLDTFTESHIQLSDLAGTPMMQVASVGFAQDRTAHRGGPDPTSPHPIADHNHAVKLSPS